MPPATNPWTEPHRRRGRRLIPGLSPPHHGGHPTPGPGKVAVCTKCPNMPVAGICLPAWTTRSRGAGPRRGVIGQMGTNRNFAGALGQAETAAEGGAGGWSLPLLQVVADYKRLSAVQSADHAGDGRASGPQYPGVRSDPYYLAKLLCCQARSGDPARHGERRFPAILSAASGRRRPGYGRSAISLRPSTSIRRSPGGVAPDP
jgi:hypothetical protein